MDSGSRYLSRSIRVEAARELGLGNWAGLVWNEARIPAGFMTFFASVGRPATTKYTALIVPG